MIYFACLDSLKEAVSGMVKNGAVSIETEAVPLMCNKMIPFVSMPINIINDVVNGGEVAVLDDSNELIKSYLDHLKENKVMLVSKEEDNIQNPEIPYNAKFSDYVNLADVSDVTLHYGDRVTTVTEKSIKDFLSNTVEANFDYFKLPMYNWGTYYCSASIAFRRSRDKEHLITISAVTIEPYLSLADWEKHIRHYLNIAISEGKISPGETVDIYPTSNSLYFSEVDLATI